MTKKIKINSREDAFAGSIDKENRLESSDHNYLKLQVDLSDEIRYFIKEIRVEIEWLHEHCETEIDKCGSREDLSKLVRLKDYLEKIREDMRRKSYEFSGCDEFIRIPLNWMPPVPPPQK